MLFFLFLVTFFDAKALAFSMSTPPSKEIYGVPKSGWTASEWNWGYAVGTGHDCAAKCRQIYDSRDARASLVRELCSAPTIEASHRKPEDFEEVKLVLALAWQRGRWDGSDGGRGGYGEVLAVMAKACRYESEDDNESSRRLVKDMVARFQLLRPEAEKVQEMATVIEILDKDTDAARRKCSGLVLDAMGFVDSGL